MAAKLEGPERIVRQKPGTLKLSVSASCCGTYSPAGRGWAAPFRTLPCSAPGWGIVRSWSRASVMMTTAGPPSVCFCNLTSICNSCK